LIGFYISFHSILSDRLTSVNVRMNPNDKYGKQILDISLGYLTKFHSLDPPGGYQEDCGNNLCPGTEYRPNTSLN